MLADFWKLNNFDNVREIETQEEFESIMQKSKDICNYQYNPPTIKKPKNHPAMKFTDHKFSNVSFSKTIISNVVFIKCEFKNCLFVGVKFINCKFSDCIFEGINMAYVEFQKIDINPKCLKDIFAAEQANLAADFYQALFKDLKHFNQTELAAEAEYYYMVWTKKDTWKKIQDNKGVFKKTGIILYLYTPLFLQRLIGFGVRFLQYLCSLLVVFIALCGINFYFWSKYVIIPPTNQKISTVIFYTFYTFTSYGSTPMSPSTAFGITFAILQGILGWIFLGIGLAMISKKLIR